MKAIVPLDGSQTALAILPTVRDLVALAPDVELMLVTVMDPRAVRGRLETPVMAPPGAGIATENVRAPAPRMVESHGEALERKATEGREKLEAIAATELPGVDAAARIVWSGSPADAICRLAEETSADLIVMGTHGRSGLGHVLAGSVAEAVIRQSGRPVLVRRTV